MSDAAKEWARWLERALMLAGKTPAALAAASDGKIGTPHLTYWTTGQVTADPDDAVLVAHLLDADPADAMQAAGYAEAADALRLADGEQPAADTAAGDPVFAAILAAGFDAATRADLIAQRAVDLHRIEKARSAAEEIGLMRVSERKRKAGPWP